MKVNPLVRQVVSRCHVADGFRAVLRYMLSRMKPGAWQGCNKEMKRSLWNDLVKVHKENRKLYSRVA